MKVGCKIGAHIPPRVKLTSNIMERCKNLVVILPRDLPLSLPAPLSNSKYPHWEQQLSTVKNTGEDWMYPTESSQFSNKCLVVSPRGRATQTPGFSTLDDGEVHRIHQLAGGIPHKLKSNGIEEASIYIHPELMDLHPDIQGIVLNGIILGGYEGKAPGNAQTGNDNGTPTTANLSQITLLSEADSELQSTWWRMMGQSTIYTRNLLRQTGSVGTPKYVEEVARELVEELQREGRAVRMTHSLRGDDLAKDGLNLLYAVGCAAETPPALIILEYRGDPHSEDTLALVGKGVSYDTGGLNLKGAVHMNEMHLDKGGACSVLGAFRGIALSGARVNVNVALALAENAIGPRSYKPGDIIQGHNGVTVEIGNTDAEGRLCLADAISYVQKECSPKVLIDMATLTGAVVVALGVQTAGVMGNHLPLTFDLCESGNSVFEYSWPLPIARDHIQAIKGTYADISNIGKPGAGGGSSCAGAFLGKFVEEGVKWAHVDVAGTMFGADSNTILKKGGTGWGVHTLMQFVRRQLEKERGEEGRFIQ